MRVEQRKHIKMQSKGPEAIGNTLLNCKNVYFLRVEQKQIKMSSAEGGTGENQEDGKEQEQYVHVKSKSSKKHRHIAVGNEFFFVSDDDDSQATTSANFFTRLSSRFTLGF